MPKKNTVLIIFLMTVNILILMVQKLITQIESLWDKLV